jgi:hypothetical protein
MFSIKTRMTAAIALALSLTAVAFGQQATTAPSPEAQPARAQTATPAPQASAAPPAARSAEYVEEKGFKTKIVEVKHRDPDSLYRVVRSLGSGFKGARIDTDPTFKTMTIRDFPENIGVIEEALKRLDTPEAPRPDIEIHVHVLIASNTAGSAAERPAELDDVVKQLQGTLAYKHYSMMTSSVHRTKEGISGVSNSGVAESNQFAIETSKDRPIFYSYELRPVTIDSSAAGPSRIQIGNFVFDMRIPLNLGGSIQYQPIGFRTPVNVREGEKVVVGTTTMADKGLIVVLQARVVK